MKIKITIICILVYCLGSLSTATIHAQQDSQYTQYMYNPIVINPAYAGNREALSINSLYRAQWIGLVGAPRTLTFSVNSPLGFSGLGMGLSVVKDDIGPASETFASLDFSYTIRISDYTRLSFGIKGGLNILNINFNKPELNWNPADLSIVNINNRVSPAIGAGLYYHSDRWYVGLSTPNFLRTDHYRLDGNSFKVSNATEEAHYYLIGGYVFDLNDNLKLKPSVLVKTVSGSPLSVDFSANFLINQDFTLGLAYRLDSAISALVGFQISDKLMLGYAYDYDNMDLGDYNSGSHEFFLRFELPTRLRKIVNPRFF